ncbi:MAG TPA: CHASE3 domain-containing protein [Candidatus Didemnitutus sp.]|jgi:PAS domain S-box-containing protein
MSSPRPKVPSDRIFRRVLAFFLLVFAVLGLVVTMALRNLGRAQAASEWVNHTHAVRAEAADILSSLNAAEAALRTFLVTDDPRDQADYRVAFSDLAEHVDVAKALTRSAPDQYQQITQLEDLVAKRADLAREIIRVRQKGSPAELQSLLASDAGGVAVHEIARRVERFRAEQADLLNERDRISFLQAHTTRWTVLAGLVLDLLLLAGAAWLIRDDLRARQQAGDALREANEQLEARVQARTAELTAANQSLKAGALEDRWARQALEHQLRYNQLIIDSIAELAIVVTRMLNVSRINPAVERLTGWEAADMVDRPLGNFVELVAGPGAADPLARALKDGHDLQHQPATIADKSGRRHPLELSFFPLRDGNKVVGGVVTLRTRPPVV